MLQSDYHCLPDKDFAQVQAKNYGLLCKTVLYVDKCGCDNASGSKKHPLKTVDEALRRIGGQPYAEIKLGPGQHEITQSCQGLNVKFKGYVSKYRKVRIKLVTDTGYHGNQDDIRGGNLYCGSLPFLSNVYKIRDCSHLSYINGTSFEEWEGKALDLNLEPDNSDLVNNLQAGINPDSWFFSPENLDIHDKYNLVNLDSILTISANLENNVFSCEKLQLVTSDVNLSQLKLNTKSCDIKFLRTILTKNNIYLRGSKVLNYHPDMYPLYIDDNNTLKNNIDQSQALIKRGDFDVKLVAFWTPFMFDNCNNYFEQLLALDIQHKSCKLSHNNVYAYEVKMFNCNNSAIENTYYTSTETNCSTLCCEGLTVNSGENVLFGNYTFKSFASRIVFNNTSQLWVRNEDGQNLQIIRSKHIHEEDSVFNINAIDQTYPIEVLAGKLIGATQIIVAESTQDKLRLFSLVHLGQVALTDGSYPVDDSELAILYADIGMGVNRMLPAATTTEYSLPLDDITLPGTLSSVSNLTIL